jgi:hypothetical protein
VAVTAGASAPERLVQELITAIQTAAGATNCQVIPLIYKQESTVFKLPKQLVK